MNILHEDKNHNKCEIHLIKILYKNSFHIFILLNNFFFQILCYIYVHMYVEKKIYLHQKNLNDFGIENFVGACIVR